MKICVDENIPLETAAELKSLGHDVLDIRGTSDQGISDEFLWERMQREKRLLITTDKGFVSRRFQPHHGVIVVRLRKPNARKIHERVMRALNQFSENEWIDLIVVMRDTAQSVWRAT